MPRNSSPLKRHHYASDALILRLLRHYRYQILLTESERGDKRDFMCKVHGLGYKDART
jgi:hypothetical protein